MRISWLLWPIILTVASGAVIQTKSIPPKPGEDWLLPGNVEPVEYKLDLKTHIDKFSDTDQSSFTYEGEVAILINVLNDTENIKIHRNDSLTLVKGTLLSTAPDSQPSNVTFLGIDFTTGILSLTNDKKFITKGQYVLSISFIGIHWDNMRGFYRSYYYNGESKTKRWLISTQFAPSDARAAFPCFDEPKYKAKFTISVEFKTQLTYYGYSALSNMPIEKEERMNGTGTTKITFKKSALKLSTYLVAFIVSDFRASEPNEFLGGKLFKTWGSQRFIDNKMYSMSQTVGPDAFNILQSQLKIDYDLPKLDQVGIPDFSFGAMENWGLCTYKDRNLFLDVGKESASRIQSSVAMTVHELSHQWFGDLVTLHWWSDIWLNEGFATFMEYHITGKLTSVELNTSSWQLVGQMVTDEMQNAAFATDAVNTSRPLSSKVFDPSIYGSYFDDISYSKGGSVLRMWMHAMGEDLFYSALNNYLQKRKEDVATPLDLQSALIDELPDTHILKNATSAFEDWYSKPGYPLVVAKRNDDFYRITQERFLLNGDSNDEKWTIPISYLTSEESSIEDTSPRVLLKNEDNFIDVKHDNSTWILLNIQQTGYYRVNYDNKTWLQLTETLFTEPQKISNINRAQLIDDALSLSRSSKGYVSYNLALNLTNYLVNETDLIPWKAALNSFEFIHSRLAMTQSKGKLTRFLSNLLQPKFNNLTLTAKSDDSHTTRILRQIISAWSCKLDVEECVDEALRKYADNEIEADVQPTVLCTFVAHGDGEDWHTIWSLYNNSIDSAEKAIYISALGCTRDLGLIDEYLRLTLDDLNFRSQDRIDVFKSVINGNVDNVNVALRFISQNLEEIALSYGGMDPLGALLSLIAPKLGTEEDLKAMKAIKTNIEFSSTLIGAAGYSIDSAISIVQSNLEWTARRQDEIVAWLDENDANTTYITPILLLILSLTALFMR